MCRAIIILAIVAILPGCGGRAKNPVEGNITFRGKPLADGYITFFPAGREGTSIGASIADGRYTLDDVPPGSYRVLVSTHPKVDVSAKPKLIPTVDVPTTAVNNNKTHEIGAGQKTFDLTISQLDRQARARTM